MGCTRDSLRFQSTSSLLRLQFLLLFLHNNSAMFAARTNWNLAENRLTLALAEHRRSGRPLFDLTISNPTECAFSYDESAILAALRTPAALRYEPAPQGLLSAREAVAPYYRQTNANISPSDLF